MLIVFGGLPGTGKTTLARAFAQERRATYLRIDTIEQALRSSEMLAGDVGPAGYMVAYALAEANLRLGGIVVADSVNPLTITRDAWRNVAAMATSAIFEIEVVCSDADQHPPEDRDAQYRHHWIGAHLAGNKSLSVIMRLGIGRASPTARQLRCSKSYALGSTVVLPAKAS
jgi:adenylylsulfate kinase-like enzyme